MGKMVELGLMQGVPQWLTEKGGTLLFFLSFTQQTVVTKGGIRQAGAFLLRPGEEIILRNGAEKKRHDIHLWSTLLLKWFQRRGKDAISAEQVWGIMECGFLSMLNFAATSYFADPVQTPGENRPASTPLQHHVKPNGSYSPFLIRKERGL